MSQVGYQKTIQVKTTSSTAYSAIEGINGSMNLARDVLDDTDFTSTGWRSKALGLKDYTTTISANYNTGNTAFTTLRAAFLAGTSLDFQYLPNGTAGFTGRVVVATFGLSGDVGGLESVDITLESDGTALTTA